MLGVFLVRQMTEAGFSTDEILDMLSPEARAALAGLADSKLTENKESGNEFVSENFGFSQFWYDEETANVLAAEAMEGAKEAWKLSNAAKINESSETMLSSGPSIACLMAPSAFRGLQVLKNTERAILFEFDKRFEKLYGESFTFFDVNHPRAIDKEFLHSFDFIIADPPHLNADCIARTHETISLLSRDSFTRVIFNTVCLPF